MTDIRKQVRAIVEEAPAVDVHSHQGTRDIWQAASLWEIFSYHWLAADIRCAGAPKELFSSREMDAKDRMAAAIPYCKFAANTVNFWCFMNIARDLYGFRGDVLEPNNWEWLWDAVEEKAADPQWELHVLERSGVELASAAHQHERRFADKYFAYEYGEYMFCAGLGSDAKSCFQRLGSNVDSAQSLAAAIEARINDLATTRDVKALHVWAPIEWDYGPVQQGQADALVHKVMASAHLEAHEKNLLGSYVANVAAEFCGKHGIVIQLFLGSAKMEEDGPFVSMYRPEWLRRMVHLFAEYPQTNFDLFLATRPISHEAAVLARNYPNLWVSGAWWQGFTPTTLSVFFRDRLEMLPMNKWNAFYSDAYCAEWVYGKCSLARARLAEALSAMVSEGMLDMGHVGDITRCVLRDNARRLYLGEDI